MMKKYYLMMLLLFWTVIASAISTPRAEYPRPQFERSAWQNLNGQWTYTFDFGKSGMDRKLFESKGFNDEITVPYCPQSKLSGVAYTDFINAMWYHRSIQIPADWSDKKVVLHFGAVDYFSAVYIDGELVGRHWGGTSSFEWDITSYVKDGKKHNLVVRVEDDERSGNQMKGKQSSNFFSQGCDYTRTTGIWQTVWMEALSPQGLKNAYIVPDLDQKQFIVSPIFYALQSGEKLKVTIKDGNKVVSTKTVIAATPSPVVLPINNPKTWSPESPFLYNVEYDVLNKEGKVIDHINAYAGMRKVHIEGNVFYLNNKPYYLRLVLDQGFYPTGIWTAPTDADLKNDIQLSMDAGFNGARLHQKVFEPRFHYWADKMGYLTWGESSSWGADANKIESARNYLAEWREIVLRDRNCPSIIAWTPFNETWERPRDSEQASQHDRLVSDIYQLTHSLDYRPVNDVSGNFHVVTDLWTVHNYEQKPSEFSKQLAIKNGVAPQFDINKEVKYRGQPYFVDEYGGVKWIVGAQNASNSWGYGDGPKTEQEYLDRIKGLTDVILSNSHIWGYCYTQLTDVEQEQNGVYNYDRSPKFDIKLVHDVFSKNPSDYAVEKQVQDKVNKIQLLKDSDFDQIIDGKPVKLYTLRSGNGLVLQITNFGARMVSLWTPDKNKHYEDVILGYSTLDQYVNNTGERFLGPIVGRYANRIALGKFTLDGKEYQLPINNNGQTLHGGIKGTDLVVWTVNYASDKSIEMTYVSPDGSEGFPGNLEIKVNYTVNSNDEVAIRYSATTDKSTIVNLSSHGIYNLKGQGNGTITDHVLMINASEITPIDDVSIPTGEITNVRNTAFDFRKPIKIGARIDDNEQQLKNGRGYDHNWIIDRKTSNDIELNVTIYEPISGRSMEVWSDQPGIQFYSGNFFDGKVKGKYGKSMNFREGFALETQKFPDSPNHSNFSNSRLNPGETYHQTCIYKFGVMK